MLRGARYIYGVRGWFEKKSKNWLVDQVYILGAGKRGDGELGGVPYWLRGGRRTLGEGGRGKWVHRVADFQCLNVLKS